MKPSYPDELFCEEWVYETVTERWNEYFRMVLSRWVTPRAHTSIVDPRLVGRCIGDLFFGRRVFLESPSTGGASSAESRGAASSFFADSSSFSSSSSTSGSNSCSSSTSSFEEDVAPTLLRSSSKLKSASIRRPIIWRENVGIDVIG